jgi:gamma-glutamyltranspeptidase/glutathione hydrolase
MWWLFSRAESAPQRLAELIMQHRTRYNRRDFLIGAGGAVAGLAASRTFALSDERQRGLVVSESEASQAGMEILAAGGNAVDAAVAAALVGCVVSISKCGIGGYGGHMMIARPAVSDGARGRPLTAIDFNSAAPAAARADMFPHSETGRVRGNLNDRGWLAAGVPGTLAGLQLALDKYGRRSFPDLVQPAIHYARNGFPLRKAHAFWTRQAQRNKQLDPSLARLLVRNGMPLKEGQLFRNPELADMLAQLAENGSVEGFYRGEIAGRIADAFQKNGGLVTAQDMASYEAREVVPLVADWRGHTFATAPLTAGGFTILQALAALKALGWPDELPASAATVNGSSPRSARSGSAAMHAWLEALRIAWDDRLALLGDDQYVDVPVKRLLSQQYARQSAEKITMAVAQRRPVSTDTDARPAGGTLHVSAVDADGMMAALTLTHGDSFGAQIAVDGLGLILGHGMSRFDPVPGRPNSIAPGKRPLHNMCPTIVLQEREPRLALGATGGRRIPNAVFQVLLHYLADGGGLQAAASAPRVYTEGGLDLRAEPWMPEAQTAYLKKVGYRFVAPLSAFVYALERPDTPASPPIGVADHIANDIGLPGVRSAHPLISRGE